MVQPLTQHRLFNVAMVRGKIQSSASTELKFPRGHLKAAFHIKDLIRDVRGTKVKKLTGGWVWEGGLRSLALYRQGQVARQAFVPKSSSLCNKVQSVSLYFL